MTDRERWVVYPLLFLAIGMAMKNSIELQAAATPEATLKSANIDIVHCKQLFVVNENQTPQIVLSTNSNGGVLSLLDPSGHVLRRYMPLEVSPKAEPQSAESRSSDTPIAPKSN